MENIYKQLANNQKMFIAVAGNIGIGKTTLTNKLAQRLNWRPYFESVTDNPYLADFYGDMKKWSFPLQVYFLNHRFNTHRHIEMSSASSIQDRSIYEDARIFARSLFEQGLMTQRDYENYVGLYESIIKFLNPPTLMIFLKRSVPNLMERIRERGRDYEQGMGVDYLSKLNDYYGEWFDEYNLGRSLCIDTDNLDFLNNEDHFNQLVLKIHESIDQQDLLLQV